MQDNVDVVGKGKNWTLEIVLDGDGIGPYDAVKVTYGGVEHTYDVEKLKKAFVWLLKPYEIYENPSYECMRRAREESRAELLEMRRWDVSRRLKALQLPDSGSHDMLSRIARIIYPTTTGWTREACEYLRDHLAELIGGERDAQRGCSGGAGDCVCHDVQEEVSDGISRGDCGVREICHDRDLRDMGNCHISEAAVMTYDVLGNERHKAVCELSSISVGELVKKYDYVDIYPEFIWAVGQAIGLRYGAGFEDIVNRLIHLLGGKEGREECPVSPHFVENQQNHQKEGELSTQNDENGEILQTSDYLDLLRDAACEYKELHDLVESIEHDVNEGGWMTLFGVNYTPVSTDYETFNDVNLINLYYKKLKQWMGEAKSFRDSLAVRVDGRDHVRQELEECRKALNEANGRWAKADAECRMYRDLLNDEAREYVRHMEATDSMYASFNEVFEAMRGLF